MSDIVQRLGALYVWPQSVADHHADILTPRQIEKLYAVGQAGTEAAAEITRLTEALRAAEEREKAVLSALEEWMFRYFWRVDGMPVEAARIHAQSRMKIAALVGGKP